MTAPFCGLRDNVGGVYKTRICRALVMEETLCKCLTVKSLSLGGMGLAHKVGWPDAGWLEIGHWRIGR